MKNTTALLITLTLSSLTASANADLKAEIAKDHAAQMEVYNNYVPNPEDGDFAPLANRIYLKITAPHYFKKGLSLDWKDENASYWKK